MGLYDDTAELKKALLELPIGTPVSFKLPASIAPNRPELQGEIAWETTFGFAPKYKVVRFKAFDYMLDMVNPLDLEVLD